MRAKERSYYDLIRNALIGRKISNVYYEELLYPDGKEYWKLSETCHSIDMNVILELAGKDLVQIKWDSEFYCYGLGLEQLKSSVENREGIKRIVVSNEFYWAGLLNVAIVEVKVYWNECSASSTNYLPHAWEVKFDNDNVVWIFTTEIIEGEIRAWADHLTVLFAEDEKANYGLTKNCTEFIVIR